MRDNMYQNKHDRNTFLKAISNFSQLFNEKFLECEKCITEKVLLEALKVMPDEKSCGNDDLTKEFFETFWFEVEKPLLSCILHPFGKE